MSGLTRQAMIVSASRFINQGLMVLSPLILVRLLSVEDFGVYREFLLYATLVGNFAAFSLANSLLYFIGLQPGGAWGYVDRICKLVAMTSLVAAAGFAVADHLTPGGLIGTELWPCILYVLFYVNVDFWEFLWVAQQKPNLVMAYTAGRLVLRITVVVAVAFLTRDVQTIIWSLVVLEGLRLAISTFFWSRLARRAPPEPLRVSWRDQLEFCVPSGLVVFVTTLNSSLGGMFISQSLGEAALAHFVIGGYVVMVVYPLRNSVSDVLLPRMASLAGRSPNGWLPLWQKSVVLFAIMLVPVAAVLARYAEIFVTTAFSEKYRDAIPIFQIHCALLLLSCFDVAVALRAINRTRALLLANFVCIAANLLGILWLMPRYGVLGAGYALVLSTVIALAYLLVVLARMQGLKLSAIVPFGTLGRILAAAGLAMIVTLPEAWTAEAGLAGAMVASLAFGAIFLGLLRAFRVAEIQMLFDMVAQRLQLKGSRA